MLVINLTNYKTKRAITAYLFAPCIANKSMIAGNISVFENLNIN